MRAMRLVLPITACALLVASACDLPQDKDKTYADDVGDANTSEVGEGEHTWKMLRITDESAAEDDSAPGADIDAIVVFRDDEFVFAGCAEATLFGEDEAHKDNDFVDPDRATLAVREQSEGNGFVSLGGGTLFCELPLALRTGDKLTIWEMEADAKDGWRLAVAASAGDEYSDVGAWRQGSAEIEVP